MWCILFAGLAHAGEAVISASGGEDFPTGQLWAGADLEIQATNTKGVALVGRVTPAFGFGDQLPIVFGEFGFMAVAPQKEAIIRLGLIARPELLFVHYRVPIALGASGTFDTVGVGIGPGGMGRVEFEWPDKHLAFGAQLGIASAASDQDCAQGNPDESKCMTWYPAAIGDFYGRKQFGKHVSVEATVGTTTQLAVGYAF